MGDEVGDIIALAEHEDNLQGTLGGECLEQLFQLVACLGIQPYERIVHDEYTRLGEEGGSQLKLSQLATR